VNKKKKTLIIGSLVLISLLIGGLTYAAFMDKGSVLGSSFSVSSSDIKLLEDLSGAIGEANLMDELVGPSFERISPYWQEDYPIKVYNNGTDALDISSTANYETAEDPAELRQLIYVEPLEWNDADTNGVVDEGEVIYSFGRKTIVKWKTEGFLLGTVNPGEYKGYILRFSTDAVSDTKQGTTGIFDFEFSSTPTVQ